jgi:diketogulonate reductase-like aldo/keto reductase
MKNISELVLFQVDCVDLYQIHGPIHLRSIEVVGNALAEAVKLGLTKTVGVSNYSTDEMIKMYDCLQKHGIQLASNQVEYSLLRRLPETSGHIAECHKRGVAVLGYCPLVSDVNKLIKIYFYQLGDGSSDRKIFQSKSNSC